MTVLHQINVVSIVALLVNCHRLTSDIAPNMIAGLWRVRVS